MVVGGVLGGVFIMMLLLLWLMNVRIDLFNISRLGVFFLVFILVSFVIIFEGFLFYFVVFL